MLSWWVKSLPELRTGHLLARVWACSCMLWQQSWWLCWHQAGAGCASQTQPDAGSVMS